MKIPFPWTVRRYSVIDSRELKSSNLSKSVRAMMIYWYCTGNIQIIAQIITPPAHGSDPPTALILTTLTLTLMIVSPQQHK